MAFFFLRRACYRQLNLPGEYYFPEQPLPAEAPFDMDLIAAWQPPSKSA